MTNKEKAEAYVRQQLPELMGVDSGRPVGSGYMEYPPILLNYWLKAIYEKTPANGTIYVLETNGSLLNTQTKFVVAHFNLTTGQPATEADYQAFNDIVGI